MARTQRIGTEPMGAGASLPAGLSATALETLPAPQQDELRRLQTSCEGDLTALLSTWTTKDVGLFKKLRKPPTTAAHIFDAVLLIFQRHVVPISAETVQKKAIYKNDATGEVVTGKETVLRLQDSWDDTLRMISDPGFLDSLRTFDCSRLNDETIELLYPYVCAADFHPTEARKAHGALGGLCDWVRALVAQKAGVEALIANARARAAAAARSCPPRPIHPVAHLLLLGSVCESSSLVRLRGRADELRMIFERVLSFSDRTAGPIAPAGSTPPRVTVAAASDAWAERAPLCPPLEPFEEGADAAKWAGCLFGPHDFEPDGAPYEGTFLRPYVYNAHHGPDSKQFCLTADGRFFLSITESGWSQARDVQCTHSPPESPEWAALQRAGIFDGWARRALELHGRGHVVRITQVVTECDVTFHVECRGTFFVSTDGTAEDPFRASDEAASTLLLAAVAEKGLRGIDGQTPPPPMPPGREDEGFQPMGIAGEGRVELVLHDATYRLEIRSSPWQRDPVASIEIVDGAWTRAEWPPAWPAAMPQKISTFVSAQRDSIAAAGEDPYAVEDMFCGKQRLWCDHRFPDVAVIRTSEAP